jgi:hypothetical protein
MIQTIAGCMDGIHPRKFEIGKEYKIDDVEINQSLVDIFVQCGAGEIVSERKMIPEAPEKVVIESAPEKKGPSGSQLSVTEPKPKIMRVFGLATKLKTDPKNILKIANELGINVRAAQAGLTADEVKRIEEKFNK